MLEALKDHLSDLSDNFYQNYQAVVLFSHMFQYLMATGDHETFSNWLLVSMEN